MRGVALWSLMLLLGAAPLAWPAAEATAPIPRVTLVLGGEGGVVQLPVALQLMALLTVLSLGPALVIAMSSFTRILVVLSFVRSALGTQQIPPNIVLAGMALFLTGFTMAPVWRQASEQGIQPYLRHEIGYEEAATRALAPVREFMLRQADERDVALFVRLGHLPRPRGPADLPIHVVVPAFMLSELRRAFVMGFLIFVPFVVIDMVVATVLMSMGMMMMPPVVISLPCKVLLFVLIDGWGLVTQSLVASFR